MRVQPKRKAKGRLMKQDAVEDEYGIPRRDIIRWSMTGAGGFPAPVRVVNRTYVFSRADLEKWAAGMRQSSAAESNGSETTSPGL